MVLHFFVFFFCMQFIQICFAAAALFYATDSFPLPYLYISYLSPDDDHHHYYYYVNNHHHLGETSSSPWHQLSGDDVKLPVIAITNRSNAFFYVCMPGL